MNDDECREVIRLLITSFPGFEQETRGSPDIAATHRAWASAWRDLEQAECVEAINDLVITGGIKQTDYKEPGPFVRKLVMDRRARTTSGVRRSMSTNDRMARLESAKQLREEFKQQKCSMAKAFAALAKGVPEEKALKNA